MRTLVAMLAGAVLAGSGFVGGWLARDRTDDPQTRTTVVQHKRDPRPPAGLGGSGALGGREEGALDGTP